MNYKIHICHNHKFSNAIPLLHKANSISDIETIGAAQSATEKRRWHGRTYTPADLDLEKRGLARYQHLLQFMLNLANVEVYLKRQNMLQLKYWALRKRWGSNHDHHSNRVRRVVNKELDAIKNTCRL